MLNMAHCKKNIIIIVNCKAKLSHEQDLVITLDEVCEVFKTLNTNKFPGPDGIPSKLLKGLLGNNFFIDSVAKLFSLSA